MSMRQHPVQSHQRSQYSVIVLSRICSGVPTLNLIIAGIFDIVETGSLFCFVYKFTQGEGHVTPFPEVPEPRIRRFWSLSLRQTKPPLDPLVLIPVTALGDPCLDYNFRSFSSPQSHQNARCHPCRPAAIAVPDPENRRQTRLILLGEGLPGCLQGSGRSFQGHCCRWPGSLQCRHCPPQGRRPRRQGRVVRRL